MSTWFSRCFLTSLTSSALHSSLLCTELGPSACVAMCLDVGADTSQACAKAPSAKLSGMCQGTVGQALVERDGTTEYPAYLDYSYTSRHHGNNKK